VKVLVGRPLDSNIPFAEMDEGDLLPIRQCSQCGLFIKTETPAIRKKHSRCLKYYNARFEPVTYTGNLIAVLRMEETSLQHQYPPGSYIDQQSIQSLLHQDRLPTLSVLQNPVSLAAYSDASIQWIRRCRTDRVYREMVEQLSHDKQRSLDLLAQRLEEFDIPTFQATDRFLMAFRSQEPLLRLDRTILLLALLLRTQAYDTKQADLLLKEIRLTDSSVEDMLETAHTVCPELLLWAITWVELFYVHACA
jgi:hypothetical protein